MATILPASGTYTYNPSYARPVSIVDALTTRGVGFQNQFRFFEELFNSVQPSKYPPYDILSIEEDKYEIRFAVAGFKKDEVDVVVQDSILMVGGNKTEDSMDAYFHKGIAARDFKHSFPLAEYVEVVGASMEDGILTVKLERNLPDSMKPRTIDIN